MAKQKPTATGMKHPNFHAKKFQVDVPEAHWRITLLTLDMVNEKARCVLAGYASETAADTEADPLETFEFTFGREPQDAQYETDAEGEPTEVLVSPAIPSFAEMLDSNLAAFEVIRAQLYGLAKTHPKLSAAEIVM